MVYCLRPDACKRWNPFSPPLSNEKKHHHPRIDVRILICAYHKVARASYIFTLVRLRRWPWRSSVSEQPNPHILLFLPIRGPYFDNCIYYQVNINQLVTQRSPFYKRNWHFDDQRTNKPNLEINKQIFAHFFVHKNFIIFVLTPGWTREKSTISNPARPNRRRETFCNWTKPTRNNNVKYVGCVNRIINCLFVFLMLYRESSFVQLAILEAILRFCERLCRFSVNVMNSFLTTIYWSKHKNKNYLIEFLKIKVGATKIQFRFV